MPTDTNATDEVLLEGLEDFVIEIGNALPNILAAIIVLILGIIIANLVANVVRRLIDWSKLDRWVQNTDTPPGNLDNMGLRFRAADVAATLTRWLLILLAVGLAADILNWTQVTELMENLMGYIPNIAAAVLILIGGYMLANFVKSLLTGTTGPAPSRLADTFGNVARGAILVFAVMAALVELGIAENLIFIAFVGLVGMVSVAGALAFGLGGRDAARTLLSDMRPPGQMGG